MRRRKEAEYQIMGIDQSLNSTGICWPNGVADVCKLNTDKSNTFKGPNRLAKIGLWLSERIDDSITHVCWESYSYGSKGRALFQIGELGGLVKMLVLGKGIPIIAVPPSTLKMFTTGVGNASKEQMQQAIFETWDYWFEDDNEADAFALMKYGYMWMELVNTKPDDPVTQKFLDDTEYFGSSMRLQVFAN